MNIRNTIENSYYIHTEHTQIEIMYYYMFFIKQNTTMIKRLKIKIFIQELLILIKISLLKSKFAPNRFLVTLK